MNKLNVGDLVIHVEEQPSGVISLRWEGASNAESPGQAIRPFFAIVASRAADSGAALEQHFEDLGFLNSSTIAVLIELIREGQQRGIGQRFYFDGSKRWQALSFSALKGFATPTSKFELIPVRTDEQPLERTGQRH